MSNKKRICVKDVMKSDYGTIDRNATILEAINEMKRLQTAVLVVNKKDEHDEYGLLLVSEIARKVLAKDRAPSRMNVYEVMTKPVVCISPEMHIRYCSRLMATLNLMRILVVQNNEVIGTVNPRALVLDGLAELDTDD